MLVLSRKYGETIVIADAHIVITVLEVHGDRVRIGIDAPREVAVHRREIWERIRNQSKDTGVDGTSHSAATT